MKPGDKVIFKDTFTVEKTQGERAVVLSDFPDRAFMSDDIAIVNSEPLELWALIADGRTFAFDNRDEAESCLVVAGKWKDESKNPRLVKLIAFEIESDGAA